MIDLVPNKVVLKSMEMRIRIITLRAPVFHARLCKLDPMLPIDLSVFDLDEVRRLEPDPSTRRVSTGTGRRSSWPSPTASGWTRSTRAGEGAGDGA